MRSLVAAAGTAAVLAVPASGQGHPSLAGAWSRVDTLPERVTVATVGDAAFRKGTMGSGWGDSLTIRQSSDSLVVEYEQFIVYDHQPRLRYAYALDGSPSRHAITIGHTESAQESRAAWRGDTLVITTRVPTPPGVSPALGEVRRALFLDRAGQMQVVVTRPGYRTPNVVRTTYARR